MGRYTLFDDYLMSEKPFSQFEALKEIQNLDIDDDRLLVPALFYLGSDRGKKKRSEKETTSLTKEDVIHLFELTHLLRKLRGHNYNIYECCFLAIGDYDKQANLLCGAAFSLISQILLLFILIYYNVSDIVKVTSWNKDWGAIAVVFITTFFFAKLVYVHLRGASDFKAVFWKGEFVSRFIKLRRALLIINILVNGGIGIVIVLFNVFFLLLSKNVNEAILNSLALFFILEIDDALKPGWDEVYFNNRITWNVWRYIDGDDVGDVQVDIIWSTCSKEDYSLLLHSDDKVFFKLTEDNDQVVVHALWQRRWCNPEVIRFEISGENGRDFFDNVKEFHCVERDVQVASFLKWLNRAEDFEACLKQFEDQRQKNEQVSSGSGSGSATTVPLASFDALASTSSFDAPSEIDVVKV